ncbi:hypothetical protein Ddc_23168 [Ditylenchus destructor]|nr:hypothetical protein Ddc_23168 [Ditylenchus destructor]
MKEDRKKMQARLAKEAEDIEWKRNDELKGENAEANKLDPQSKHQINKAEQALFNSLPKPQPGGQGVNNANRPKIEVRQPGGRIPPIGAPRFPNAGGGNGGYADTPAIPRYGQPLGGLPRIRELTPEELARKRAQDLEFEEKQMALERELQKARLEGRLNGGRERRPY